MKNLYKHKDIQRFKEISEILGIEFSEADALFFKLNELTLDERYKAMIDEEMEALEGELV